jgi:beta-glucosidase
VNSDFFSVRWTGKLRAPVTGKVRVSVTTGDGVRFIFNGRKLLESWEDRFSTTDYLTLDLVKGREYDFTLEIYEDKWEAKAFLGWDYGLDAREGARIAKAAAAAKRAGAAVIVASILEGEFIDRCDLDLPGYQEKLIRAVTATGVPTAVVLVGGSAVTMSGWLDGTPAVLDAWYGGDEGGTAVAEALFGDCNPSGRLPLTFPRSASQLPLVYNHNPTGRGYDYTFMSARPLFPFGHGLSYTRFEYSSLRFDSGMIRPDGTVRVSAEVRNVGKVRGDEVVQLYLRDLVGSVSRPVRELKGLGGCPSTPASPARSSSPSAGRN